FKYKGDFPGSIYPPSWERHQRKPTNMCCPTWCGQGFVDAGKGRNHRRCCGCRDAGRTCGGRCNWRRGGGRIASASGTIGQSRETRSRLGVRFRPVAKTDCAPEARTHIELDADQAGGSIDTIVVPKSATWDGLLEGEPRRWNLVSARESPELRCQR